MKKYIVIKFGGSVMEDLPSTFYENIVTLHKGVEWTPVIVHGGGPSINRLLEKLEIPTTFVDGLRVTSAEVLDVVEMALSGSVNKQIVRKLQQAGGRAWGISGVDGSLIHAFPSHSVQLGFVGEVAQIDIDIITSIVDKGFIPVISPLGIDDNGQLYNINGDVAASAIANELGSNLIMVSDISGVRIQHGGQSYIASQLSRQEIDKLISDGQITGGMIPKVKAALDGLAHDVPEVIIVNGLREGILLDYTAGKQVGTKIVECEEVYDD